MDGPALFSLGFVLGGATAAMIAAMLAGAEPLPGDGDDDDE